MNIIKTIDPNKGITNEIKFITGNPLIEITACKNFENV